MSDYDDCPGAARYAAAYVFGIEGDVTKDDYRVAVERLERAVRPWDAVVAVDARTIGVLCTTLTSSRETEAVGARLADVVRAPMAVGDDIRTLGVCVGSVRVESGEEPTAVLRRARDAMRQMRDARAGLLVPDLPGARDGSLVLPG